MIERFAERVILMPGWQYSSGCAVELLRAVRSQLPIETVEGQLLSISECITSLKQAQVAINTLGIPIENLGVVAAALEEYVVKPVLPTMRAQHVRKDEVLNYLADQFNVAQFVSFEPTSAGPSQTYSRVRGFAPNTAFESLEHALDSLMESSLARSINLRSYTPDSPQSREFIYGITNRDEAVEAARRLSGEGLHIIANETVDVSDGGVSGVMMGNAIEFAPDDTPRCVEKAGVASLPRDWGIRLLTKVYGFAPELDVPLDSRVEFSIHPLKRGWKNTHTLVWEYAEEALVGVAPTPVWPNNFSRLIGDKVFGLLVAHFSGLHVPKTTVVSRRLPVFTFGEDTGSGETWLRTSPREQQPGRFTTCKGWRDPFAILQVEDPSGTEIVSVLSQAGVPAQFSGAAIVTASGDIHIEGVAGEGDSMMLGTDAPQPLPAAILCDVEAVYDRARLLLGPVRFEWVHDGSNVWVVQLHRGATQSEQATIVPGQADNWVVFDVSAGLQSLRDLLTNIEPNTGVLLTGAVGLTSHVADVLRRAKLPARIADSSLN